MNIANDLCTRFQNDLSSLNRTFHFPMHNDALGCNGSADMRRSVGD